MDRIIYQHKYSKIVYASKCIPNANPECLVHVQIHRHEPLQTGYP